MSRSRSFCFTDFVLDEQFYDNIKPHVEYILYGREVCPDTSRKHLQGFIYFKNQRTLKSVIDLLKPRHVELVRGSSQDNIVYCKKSGDFFEHGTAPSQGKRTDLTSVVDDVVSHKRSIADVQREHPVAFIKYNRGFAALCASFVEPRNWKTVVRLYWGPTDTGKTKLAHELGGVIIQKIGEFIHNYSNQEHVIFDDVDINDFRVNRQWWLQVLDRYPLTVNVKGGTAQWNPKVITITTNDDPACIIDQALLRRISEIKKFEISEVSEVAGNTVQPLQPTLSNDGMNAWILD